MASFASSAEEGGGGAACPSRARRSLAWLTAAFRSVCVQSPKITGSRGRIFGVPMRTVSHLLNGFFRRAEQLADLRIRELRIVTQQKSDGIRPLAPFGNRRVARAFGAFHRRQRAWGKLQSLARVGFATPDLLSRKLAVRNRIIADDSLRDLAIGN